MLDKKPYGRRNFLQSAALFSAGLMTSLGTANLARASDESVDALVIGSGFGGAVAALRLGQAGIKTLLIERGRRWPITPQQNTFATFRQPDGRAAWLSPVTFFGDRVPIYTGVLETKIENGVAVLCGAGVGGGSLVYNGYTYQPSRELFYRVFPKDIDYDQMDTVYYPRVRSVLKPAIIPQDILASSYYLSTRLFLKQGADAGLPSRLLDVAVDWDVIRQEIQGTKVPGAIIGEHWYGINSGAKNSLDRNYLAQAEQTGNVEILPLHLATTISEVPGHGYRVSCNQINEYGEIIASKTITCRYLFLAAGSMGTSALLVKAKATGTLPRLNNYIGLEWGTNGDALAGRSGLPKPTNPGQGGPGTSVIEYFDNPFGPIAIQLAPTWNAPDGFLRTVSFAIPSVKGKFNYDYTTGSVKLNWPDSGNGTGDPKVLQLTKFAFKLLDRKNAISSFQPQTDVALGSHSYQKNPVKSGAIFTLTAHPLGGAVLGKACDFYGRVSGYQRLYVVDSALIPGSTGCTNPSFTIAALAERCLERILAEDILK
ncbi:MAG: FAD-binding protein [Komarekiella atlantica HA4396-MV6]|jgi:cholesterol oxidase|nr:FAD-binding protein [Komarekiella atlantica HA4396-MV6]